MATLINFPVDGGSSVTSVNGKIGQVTLSAEDVGALPSTYVAPVTSVNGKTGVVTGLYDEKNPPPYPVTSVNGKTGVVTGLYDENNPPPYPVTSVDGKTGDVKSYGMLGVRKVFGGPDQPMIGLDPNGAISGIYGGVPHYCYSDLIPPPYPVTKVDGNTGEVNTFSFIEGSSFPKSITKSGGLTCFSYPLQGSSSLPKNSTVVYQINFNDGAPIPVSASYIGNGYGLQCSICRNDNTSFLISLTNHNDFGVIDLTGAYICATFYPNGATSITGVTDV